MRLAMEDKSHASFVLSSVFNHHHSSSSLLQRFDTHFSAALHKEYSSKGIIVQVGVSIVRI